jgi:multiple sugar transport system permease protein
MELRTSQKLIIYTVLGIFALAVFLPFYYMIITSFRSTREIAETGASLLISDPTMAPMQELLKGTQYERAALNSLLVAAALTLGNMILCPLAGFAFAKHQFPGRDKIFVALLATMMIPGTVLLVPGFLLARDLGWLNTWLPLIVPGLAGVLSVFLSRQFIGKIPDALLNAARVDGCSELRLFFQVVFPLCKPLLATVGILAFLGSWNSFLGPLLILFDEDKFTLPLVIGLLQGRFRGQNNVQMAGALLSVLPVLIVFFVFQGRIVKSLASTGLKE